MATTRSPYAEQDQQLINWDVEQGDEQVVVGARLLMNKLFNTHRKTADNFVSLGDGGFDSVHGPILPTGGGAAAMTSAIQGAGLIGIESIKAAKMPAGHYGSPASPNL